MPTVRSTQHPPSEPAPALYPGAPFGPYLVRRLLGRGGMGDVWEAVHRGSGRVVALKVLREPIDDPSDRARFLREGRIAAELSHPNTVYVFGSEEIDGLPVIAMELAPGGTLKDLVDRDGPLPPARAVDAVLDLVAGLEAAHAAGILHRDIKPSNCFVDRDTTVKIGDFGLSVSTLTRAESQVTADGTFMGTPAYASPEQVRCDELDVRSDIYSVGATLCFLLTGRAPFREPNLGGVLAAVLEKPPTPPGKLRPGIPRGLDRVVMRCMEKDRRKRFADYAALRYTLRPYSSTAPTAATVGLRCLAGVVDAFLYQAPLVPALLALRGTDAFYAITVAQQVTYLTVAVVYFGLMEGLRGASIGKLLCGLRVVGLKGDAPGLGQATLRAAVFAAVPALPGMVMAATRGAISPELSLVALSLAFTGVLFASIRRGNGFAGLHELASRTRVVLEHAGRSRPPEQRSALPLAESEQQATLGPYSLVGELWKVGGERLLAGLDGALRRGVWILVRARGALPVSPERRDVSRPGRVHWLCGERDEATSWDAYEAPAGMALVDLEAGAQPWAAVRGWLRDLTRELSAGTVDRTLPPELDVEHIWIGADGRARVLDFAAPTERRGAASRGRPGTAELDEESAQRFLHGIATAYVRRPLPLHASSFLAELASASFSDLAVAGGTLEQLLSRPASLSHRRRLLHVALCALVPVFLAVMGGLYLILQQALESENERVLRLCLQRIDNLTAGSRAYETGPRAEAAISEALRPSTTSVPSPPQAEKTGHAPVSAQVDGEVNALETYLAARYAGALAGARVASLRLVFPLDKVRLERLGHQVLARHPSPSEDEVREAEAELNRFLDWATRMHSAPEMLHRTLRVTLTFCVVQAVGAVLLAPLLRGGMLFTLLGIGVVRVDSSVASRGLAARRALVSWGAMAPPALLALALGLVARETGWAALELVARWFLVLGPLLALAAGGLVAVLHPLRGLQDRVVGTFLVPG